MNKKEGIKMSLQYLKRAGTIGIIGLMISLSLASCEPMEQLPVSNPEPSASVIDTATPEKDETEELKGEFIFWHYNIDEGRKLAKAFEAKYPGVKIDVQTTDENLSKQYSVHMTYLFKDPPGVCVVMYGDVKTFINHFEDLSSEPYNAEELAAKMIPYTIDIGRSDDGKIRALTNITLPIGIAYKRDIAEKYLGTDDPVAISEMLSSTEKTTDTAKKLKEKSGGKVKLSMSYDEFMGIYLGGRSGGWIKEGKLNIDPIILEYVDLQKQLMDMGQSDFMMAWIPGWLDAIADDGYFMFSTSAGAISYVIEEYDTANKDTGRWGMARTPYPSIDGGVWYQ